MPRQGVRMATLKGIEKLIKRLVVEHPDQSSTVKRKLRHLVDLYNCILRVRYLQPRFPLLKSLGALSILPYLHVDDFVQELRVSQETFAYILSLIEVDPNFMSKSNNSQVSVWIQLACALHRLGHNGSGSSCGMVARAKGVGQGSVFLYTTRVIDALKKLASKWISWPSPHERKL
ncbi:hypothetical protein Ae201684P_009315 [Aphanomyces euteiches]|uniref:Uncharacterized protein n=1 Tax=Aphanomyces euteiches TaxID=100861 RepID=A0A6G0WN82_9STRA|nr:hypothetical protein Ae201684_013385 [Aphanomyces euteiches]KAH9063050.1 hypothetical protein Ae201684P_009315 [Aphanomyces euteiches]